MLVLLATTFSSCGEEESDGPAIVIVNFNSDTASVVENSSSPITIKLDLSGTLVSDGVVTVVIESSTAARADFSIEPHLMGIR